MGTTHSCWSRQGCKIGDVVTFRVEHVLKSREFCMPHAVLSIAILHPLRIAAGASWIDQYVSLLQHRGTITQAALPLAHLVIFVKLLHICI